MLNTYLYVLLYFTQSWPKNISIYATPEEDASEVQWSMAVEQHWWNSNWRKWIVCQPSEQFYNSEELFNICHVGIFMFIRRSCTYLARSFDTIRYLKGVLQNITNYWYRGFLEEMFTDLGAVARPLSELETWAKGGYQMQQKKGLMRGT